MFLAQTGLIQHLPHGRSYATQPILHDVIVRAFPHQSHRLFLSDGAGDHDEGEAHPPLFQQFKGTGSAEGRHGIIGNDHLQRTVQGLQERRFGIDALPIRIIPVSL